MDPSLKLVQVLLDVIPSFRWVRSTTQLGVCGNSWRVHSIPLSMSLVKILNNTGPRPEGHHLSLLSIGTLSCRPGPSGCDHTALWKSAYEELLKCLGPKYNLLKSNLWKVKKYNIKVREEMLCCP